MTRIKLALVIAILMVIGAWLPVGGQERAEAVEPAPPEQLDVDLLENLRNPAVQPSPLSVHPDRVAQMRGTAIPLQFDADQLDRIRFEHHLRLEQFPLPAAQRGEDIRAVALQLEQLRVLSDQTMFVLGDANAPNGMGAILPTPNVVMYRGKVAGEPDSRVFLSFSPDAVYGYIRSENQTYLISPGPHGEGRDLLIYNLDAMPVGAIPWRDFVCSTPPMNMQLDEALALPPMPMGSGSPPCRRVKLAIETDKEFTDALFGGDLTAAAVYAATLIGAATEIFLDQINVYFDFTFIRLWTGEDIWTGTNTLTQLSEFRQVWNATMQHVERDLAHMLSGRNLGGGRAYFNAVCSSSFGYALSANLNGFFPYPLQDNNSQNWDIFVFTHELGHNFNAPHTHDVCPPLDQCFVPSGGDCEFSQQCISNGTIMSYCHQCSGGYTNIVLEFHPVNRNVMLNYLNGIDGPGCPLSTGGDTCTIVDQCEWIDDFGGGTDNTVWSLKSFNGDLFAGGDFMSAGGASAVRIARYDGEDWHSIGLINNTVRTLASYEGDLVAGGLFTFAGGQVVNRIARWDGVAWSSIGGGVTGGTNPRIFAMLAHDGDLIVGGTFTQAGGQTVNRIARWDGSQWHGYGEGMNGNVYALAIYDGQLYAGGSFTTADGTPASRIARWDGEQWHAVGDGVNNVVFAMTAFQNELVAAGQFTSADGAPAGRIARWNGQEWLPLGNGMNDLVQTLMVRGDFLYAGGSFSTAGSAITSRIAAWDGEAWHGVAIGVDNVIRSIVPYANKIAVGGDFTYVGGEPFNRIALVDCDDDVCLPADLNCDGVVNVADLLILFNNWGACDDCTDCPADLNDDCVVNVADLLIMFNNWG